MINRIIMRKRIFIAIFLYLVMGAYCYFIVLQKNSQIYFFGSTMLTSTYTTMIGGIYMMVIFPLIASFMISDIFLEDEKLNLKYIWYSKYGVIKYHLRNIAYLSLVVFIVTFIGFGFNLILSYISFGSVNISPNALFSDYNLASNANDITNFNLLLKSPMKFFLLKNVYISIYGLLFAQLSYLSSSFIKNKYIIIILPTLIYNAFGLIVSVLSSPGVSLYYLLYPNFSVKVPNPNLLNLYACILILVNIFLLLFIIKKEIEYV